MILLRRILGLLVFGTGFSVMLSWMFEFRIPTVFVEQYIQMSFITSVSFVLVGIYMFMNAPNGLTSDRAQIVATSALLGLITLMHVVLFGSTFGAPGLFENMFVTDKTRMYLSETPGVPSIMTIICFVMISVSAIMKIAGIGKNNNLLLGAKLFVGTVGLIGVIGHATGQKVLYYDVSPGKLTPMALHTAILFVLVGLYGLTKWNFSSQQQQSCLPECIKNGIRA